MNIFRRPDYQSETTQFLNQLKAADPKVEEGQRAGRALLWDKEVNIAQAEEMQAGIVSQKAYPYQV